ncbi:DUF2946 family protein [Terriglobus sp. TAA 43]|uniref:DUF2946 family protein n=1 Tax=Terriglobus sp. TAA 43 TaxID=278961 RepID=UPI0012ED2EB4|nr:DUF2946 family protein [Terriglobus sp. TAA 43]
MRKLLALALLIIFGFSFVSPLLAATGSESTLPACCRKAAKHHCMAMQDDSGVTDHASHVEFRSRMDHCPCCGVLGSTAVHVDALASAAFLGNATPRSTRSGLFPQSNIYSLADATYSHGKRGPPSHLLA